MRKDLAVVCLTAGLLLPCLLGGCGDGVREDRTITFSNDGKSAGFQHGNEGVFITDSETGKAVKIFQPDETILASSTPLWSPDERRVIFTTAIDPHAEKGKEPPATLQQWDDAPQGRAFFQRAVRYTCWLREDPQGDEPAEPRKLFEADCGHVGYVAANLAVRWHPAGDKILFVQNVDETHHALFEYDLATEDTERRFPFPVSQILFDYSPGGGHLACVVGSISGREPRDGLWIGDTDGGKWWRVPDSVSRQPVENYNKLIEQLRRVRPAWSKETSQFAFVTELAGKQPQPETTYTLHIGDVETHEVRQLMTDDAPYRDLRWTPDGQKLAAVMSEGEPSLRFVDLTGMKAAPVNSRPVRRFAGWNASGTQLAYVVPTELPLLGDRNHWAILFQPQPLARDAVMLAPGDGSNPGEEVFSGMRITFPHWSPTEEKLSLWCTFTPTYRSILSELLRGGLRPGDPAAILNVATGEINWMTVNPHEKVQVGHYYMIKGDYEEALRWYEQATQELPPPSPQEATDLFTSFTSQRNFSFFHYLCLEKLARGEAAAAKFAEFERTFLPPQLFQTPAAADTAEAGEPGNGGLNQQITAILQLQNSLPRLLRNLYIAEVYLSVNAPADGERFFTAAFEQAANDTAKLSDATLLAQLLLLQHKQSEYADFATQTLAPLLLGQMDFDKYEAAIQNDAPDLTQAFELLPSHAAVTALLPMFSADFIDELPREKVAALLPEWEALRESVNRNTAKLGCDLFLHEAYRRLDREEERVAIAKSLAGNPVRKHLLPEGGIDELFRMLRRQLAELAP